MIKLGLSKYRRWRGRQCSELEAKTPVFVPPYSHTLCYVHLLFLPLKVYSSTSCIWANFMTHLGQCKPTEVAVGTKPRPQKACEFLLPLLEFCLTAKKQTLPSLLEKQTHGLIHSITPAKSHPLGACQLTTDAGDLGEVS